MPLQTSEISGITSIRLPALRHQRRIGDIAIRLDATLEQTVACTVRISHAVSGNVLALTTTFAGGENLRVESKSMRTREELDPTTRLRADDLTVLNGLLTLSGADWISHPEEPAADLSGFVTRTRDSWNTPLSFAQEQRNAQGEITVAGLRPPQVGALHALAAHWTVSALPAAIILPTGTGKTEVMLAGMVMHRPRRLLVLVPSDALRQQTADKFLKLGVLYDAGVARSMHKTPIVATLLKRSAATTDHNVFTQANVFVSTIAMIQTLPDAALDAFLALFDMVFFDEAHHIPARSWKRVYSRLKMARVVGFTATPFRLDGERVPGKVIYQFPLRLAQAQGYFQSIDFIAVDEIDQDASDLEIATRAIERLRRDRANGHPHILLARTRTKIRADRLWETYYKVLAPDLNSVVIYSGVVGKTQIARDIRRGAYPIVICVDMFGEGFDLPTLKIAAMHDIHRSLAITLQFTGRFTRTDSNLGTATLVANVADSYVRDAIADLYAEDADWNELIPGLSETAIAGHVQFGEFLDRMRSLGNDIGAFDLSILRPKTSTVAYRVQNFQPELFQRGLRTSSRLHRAWISKERNLCVVITRTPLPIDWARVKEVTDEVWDLFILSFDSELNVLFINSSVTSSLHGDLARAVSGKTAYLLSGEIMFRALSGFSRLVFHNVGLYGRGKLRFKMYTGYDVSDAISPTTQSGTVKSNVFGVGYEKGRKGSIGVSSKGRLWSMTSSSIPEWVTWCVAVGKKVLDAAIGTDSFLAHTLTPHEIERLPASAILAVLTPDEWLSTEDTIRIYTNLTSYVVEAISIDVQSRVSDQLVHLAVLIGELPPATFELEWSNESFGVTQMSGSPITIDVGDGGTPLANYLSENPPVLLLTNGSEVKGTRLLAHADTLPTLYDSNDIAVLDWSDVPIRFESKWRGGIQREESVQGRLIDTLLLSSNTLLFDDDDAGEIADVVEIIVDQQDALVRLYHCKYSGGDEPGLRVGDLYVVCGQAVKSSKVVNYPEAALLRLEHRESILGGRPTRLERGTIGQLRKLRRQAARYRWRFEIAIVQPGLSRSALTAEAATILAAADTYVLEITGSRLKVYASP
jgi:superfamily II DNA or RNA helicase